MPRAENTASVKRLRSVALKQMREVMASLESEAKNNKPIQIQVDHLKGLFEMYLGTLPASYRGDND